MWLSIFSTQAEAEIGGLTEYFPEEREFFGYVSIFGDHCDEWGYFSLDEIASVKGTRIRFTGLSETCILSQSRFLKSAQRRLRK